MRLLGEMREGGRDLGTSRWVRDAGDAAVFLFYFFLFFSFSLFFFLKKKLIRSERHILPSDCFPSPSEMNKFSVPTDETIQLRVFFSFFSFSNRN